MTELQQLSTALFPCVPRLALSSPKMSFPDILATYHQASSLLRVDSTTLGSWESRCLEGNYEHSQALLCCIASTAEHWYPLHQSTLLMDADVFQAALTQYLWPRGISSRLRQTAGEGSESLLTLSAIAIVIIPPEPLYYTYNSRSL